MPNILPEPNTRQELRNQLRARRRSLSPAQQLQASQKVLRHLMRLPIFMRSQHIALYLTADGELDPLPIAQQLWRMNKHCYLPVLHPHKPRHLWFVRFQPDTPLRANRFGIGEPDPFRNQQLPANLLDCVLLPLVGYDREGARLGMGGGFYDTTFAWKQQKPKGKPYLIGLAHECQEVPSLATDAWDIPLYGIASDREWVKSD